MMPRHNEQEFLAQVLRGHRPAIALCNELFRISQVMDDLIDKDKPVSDEQIHNAFWGALVAIPSNTFYRECDLELRPLIASALQAYRDSVEFERSSMVRHTQIAHIIRDQLTDVVISCARLVGGVEWMREVSAQIRDHFHEEDYNTYMASLALATDDTEEDV